MEYENIFSRCNNNDIKSMIVCRNNWFSCSYCESGRRRQWFQNNTHKSSGFPLNLLVWNESERTKYANKNPHLLSCRASLIVFLIWQPGSMKILAALTRKGERDWGRAAFAADEVLITKAGSASCFKALPRIRSIFHYFSAHLPSHWFGDQSLIASLPGINGKFEIRINLLDAQRVCFA